MCLPPLLWWMFVAAFVLLTVGLGISAWQQTRILRLHWQQRLPKCPACGGLAGPSMPRVIRLLLRKEKEPVWQRVPEGTDRSLGG